MRFMCTGIFIVDDLPTMRDRLRELVSEIEGVEIVGDAGTPADAIAERICSNRTDPCSDLTTTQGRLPCMPARLP
jgi:chemotaxis response regulator CheB